MGAPSFGVPGDGVQVAYDEGSSASPSGARFVAVL